MSKTELDHIIAEYVTSCARISQGPKPYDHFPGALLRARVDKNRSRSLIITYLGRANLRVIDERLRKG